jgi:hypothetical protein
MSYKTLDYAKSDLRGESDSGEGERWTTLSEVKGVETLEPGEGLAHTINELALGLVLSNTVNSLHTSYIIWGLVAALVRAPRGQIFE